MNVNCGLTEPYLSTSLLEQWSSEHCTEIPIDVVDIHRVDSLLFEFMHSAASKQRGTFRENFVKWTTSDATLGDAYTSKEYLSKIESTAQDLGYHANYGE